LAGCSLRQLFDRVYPILVRFIYKRVWDADQAEDIAQEAFVRLLDERPDNPEAWLFTVAGNLARNAVRGEVRQTRRLSLIAGGDADRVAAGADRMTLQHETARQVGSALETLSERDRTLLLLHHDGVAYKELAVLVGVKASSIAPLLARARQRFLKSIPADGSHGDPRGITSGVIHGNVHSGTQGGTHGAQKSAP
jgi:RNA polymerase sigma factor (sigma-70 family)